MQFDAQAIFGPAGLLAQHLPGYEFRQEQVDMAEHIYGALVNKGHALVEAGTGVGKSLAYLVPLIYYTVNEGSGPLWPPTPSPSKNSSSPRICRS